MSVRSSNKLIICDASSLISMTESCMFGIIEELSNVYGVDFYLSPKVKFECIDNPIKMRSHALTAVRLKAALQRGSLKLTQESKHAEINRILDISNKVFRIGRFPLRIMHLGEADMIATAKSLGTKNILIDERTTRMLVEDSEKLRKHMEREFRKKVEINENYLQKFSEIAGDLNIVRSSELVMMAYEMGHFRKYGKLEKKTVESSLYGLKFNGCGISFSEIDEFCNMIR